jgi:hypothetical protein
VITPCDLARLALDLGKATFDNAFTSVSVAQGWAEGGVRHLVGSVPFVPALVKDVVEETIGFLERTRGDLKHTVDRCYRLAADAIAADLPGATAEPASPVTPARVSRAS